MPLEDKRGSSGELLLRAAFDSLPAQVAVLGRRGEILAVNRAWRAVAEPMAPGALFAGWREGTSYLQVCESSAARGCAAAGELAAGLREVLAGARAGFDCELDCPSPERRRWFVAHVSAVESGPAAAVVVHEEITQARAATESLRRSEELLRTFVVEAPVALAMLDREMRYVSVSRRWLADYGLGQADLVGRSHYEVFPEIGDDWKAAHQRGLAGEVVGREQDRFDRADGTVQWLRWEVRPWRDASGGVGGILICSEDVTPDGRFRGYRGIDRDVTERERAERRAATQAEVSRVLAASSSLAEAARPVLEAIGRCEGWQAGALWLVDLRKGVLRCLETWRADPRGLGPERAAGDALARGEGFAGQVWDGGRPLVRRGAEREAGAPTSIGFPILGSEEVLGVVSFRDDEAQELAPGLLEACEEIGRRIGQFAERSRAEESLKRFVSGSPAVIYALRVGAEALELVWHGGNLETMTGWLLSEADSRWWNDNLHPEDRERVLASNSLPYEIDHQVTEYRFRRRDGKYLWIRDERRLQRDEEGRPAEIIGSWTDVTERVELEQRLRRTEKLEAIGRLAGGIAHDFNNVLTVIAGSGDLLARELAPEGPQRRLLDEIRDAGVRAAALTRQLLAFSRNQVLAPRVLTLSSVVLGVEPMLRRLLGEDVLLTCDLLPEGGHALVDPGQLEQVIVNLAVNSRDAMPSGGRLTLATDVVEVAASADGGPSEIVPGRYARLSVLDTGTGMSAEVRERIFDPFFTTKPQGVGTGLGLATVFGIVKQSGGSIEVESEPGVGSCFRIYLPEVAPPAPAPKARSAAAAPSTGRETVLLVEDEPAVRRIAQIALERQGYSVLVAAGGREAIELETAHEGTIDLLLTDLVMPGMGGLELAQELSQRRPGLAVLLMSGYSDDPVLRRGITDPDMAFLQKPFALAALAAKVRSVLDGRPR
jgi:PAS domain S-box-containing protein